MSVVKKGVLTKQGHFVKNWKERLFELDADNAVLRYYTLQGKQKGEFPLTGSWVQHVDESVSRKAHSFEIVKGEARLLMCAGTEEMANTWAQAVDQVAAVHRAEPSFVNTLAQSPAAVIDVNSPISLYTANKIFSVASIEGLGFYSSPTLEDTASSEAVFVFEVHTAISYWHIYKRYCDFEKLAGAMFGPSFEGCGEVPPLPAKILSGLLVSQENAKTQQFKALFEWLQAILQQQQEGSSDVLCDGTFDESDANGTSISNALSFLIFLVESGNCPERPYPLNSALPLWAHPPGTKEEEDELAEIAIKVGVSLRVSEYSAPNTANFQDKRPQGALEALDEHASEFAVKEVKQQTHAANAIQTMWRAQKKKSLAMSAEIQRFLSELQHGIPVVKHGRRGKPHSRRIQSDSNFSMLTWKTKRSQSGSGCSLKKILTVCVGNSREGSNFQKGKKNEWVICSMLFPCHSRESTRFGG